MKARGRAIAEVEGQAPVPGSGKQPTELLQALLALRDGDFSVRLPSDWTGLAGKVADTFNDIAAANARLPMVGTSS